MRRLFLAWFLLIACACSHDPAGAPGPAAAPKPAPLILGEPPSGAQVALSDLAKNPQAFEGRSFVTSGTVTAVCQHMGCWMEIHDESSDAHIRMHGHSFFVPKTASGRHAKVMATVVPADDAKECDENAAHVAKVELDSTGIELD